MTVTRVRTVAALAVCLSLLACPALATAGTTVFKAQFACNDRGAIYPLANARVELRERGFNGEEALPRFLDPTWAVAHADQDGRVAIQLTGPEENWRGKSRNFYFRIVLTDNDGVRAEDWWAPWAWFADTPTNQNDVPVQDYRTQGIGNGTISPECAAFEGARRAYQSYRSEVGQRPPYGDLKINVNSPSDGVPFSPYVRIQWPPRHPPGDAPGGFETTSHEFAHTVRHGVDGGPAHFLADAARFNYLRHHSVCQRTNEGFAFNEGWASYWASDYAPAPNCPGVSAQDYAVEGNVAAALDRLDRFCAGVDRPQMVDVLRRNPGRIHSYAEFLDAFRLAPGCQPTGSGSIAAPLPPAHSGLGLSARIGFAKSQLRALKLGQTRLRGQLRTATRLAARRNPCRPRPCVRALLNEISPTLLAVQRQQTSLLRKTLAFQASKRQQQRLAGLDTRHFLRLIDARARSLSKGYTAIAARGMRRALQAARPYRSRGGAPVVSIIRRMRGILRSLAAGRLPSGFGFSTPAGASLRSSAPPPPPTTPPPPADPPPAPKPDLVVDSIELGLIDTGELLPVAAVDVVVRNAGNAAAGASTLELTLRREGEQRTHLLDTPALVPEQSTTIQMVCDSSFEADDATARADSTNVVVESDEANNTRTRSGDPCFGI